VTEQKAKDILSLYRPGTADDRDPEFAEVLAFARRSRALGEWFAEHCAVRQALQMRFRQITPPEGLKEQIISEHHAWVARQRWQRPVALVAVAAVIATLIAVAALWLQPNNYPEDKANLATFRKRMVSTVLRNYTMTLETNNLKLIRSHLAQSQAPADYILPKPLEKTETTGCGVLSWQEKRVSMVCFHSGKPLPPGEKTDIFLFVVDRDAVPDAPSGRVPQIAKVNKLLTASWTRGRNVYVLAIEGGEASIRRYLE
jgi:uncharacterized membrane protein YbaN (DUF454 family)